MLLEVYTDGSATVATKPGGYGWVIVVDGQKVSEGNGHMLLATNNDAELEAAIQGLAAAFKLIAKMKQDYTLAMWQELGIPDVVLKSDSQIILRWADGEARFKQKSKIKKFEALRALMLKLNARTEWVEGHSGHEHNERCDRLANLGRLNLTEEEFNESKKKKKKIKPVPSTRTGTIALWYRNTLKIVDLANNLIEDYDPAKHGERQSRLEVR